jgi:hypothetical protein
MVTYRTYRFFLYVLSASFGVFLKFNAKFGKIGMSELTLVIQCRDYIYGTGYLYFFLYTATCCRAHIFWRSFSKCFLAVPKCTKYEIPVLCISALAICGTSIFLVAVHDIHTAVCHAPRHSYRGLPCSAAFLLWFAMVRGTHLSADPSKKYEIQPQQFYIDSSPVWCVIFF